MPIVTGRVYKTAEMNRFVRVSIAVLLLTVISSSLARTLDNRGYSISGNKDSSSIHASETHDLSTAGNSPKKNVNSKKHTKNSAGKSDEGGFYKTYGSDAEGEKGYLKQTHSKGDHGYKTLDTFHKKDGDNYGFEEHTAFGKARGRDKGGEASKSGSYSTKGNHDGDHQVAGTIVDTHYAKEGDSVPAAAEGEGSESGESGTYSDGGDGGYYGSEGDGGYYGDGDSDGGNYNNSDGYNEQYSTEGGDDGSYGSSSSYSTDGEGDGDDY